MPTPSGPLLEALLDDVAGRLGGGIAQARATAAQLHTLCREAGDAEAHESRDRAAAILARLTTAEISGLLRLITVRFHLLNTGEQLQIIEVNRQREAEGLRPESIAEAAADLRPTIAGLEGWSRVLAGMDVGPTLTAHPTEARRRTVLLKQVEAAACLRRLATPGLLPREREDTEGRLREILALMLLTDDVRAKRLTVEDEVLNGVYFLSTSIWRTAPRLMRDIARETGIPARDLAPLVRWRTWIGGDRDGNPSVTHTITRATLARLRSAAVELWTAELLALEQDLSLSSRRAAQTPEELRAAIEKDAAWFADEHRRSHRALEPLRLRLLQVRTRLGADPSYTSRDLTADLELVERALRQMGGRPLEEHAGLAEAILRARTFGLHLAALDIRQHSAVHERAVHELLAAGGVCADYRALPEAEKAAILRRELATPRPLAAPDARSPPRPARSSPPTPSSARPSSVSPPPWAAPSSP
jgi:phosphoenolpyruvate carboxylase